MSKKLTPSQVEKRNYWLLLGEGVIFHTGFMFIDMTAVMSLFIVSYTGSLALGGLAFTLRTTMLAAGELVFGPYTHKFRDHAKVVRVQALLTRWLPFLACVALMMNLERSLTGYLVIIVFALFNFSDGLIIMPWTEVLSRTLTSKARSSMLGIQVSAAGVGSIGATLVIKLLMDNPQLSEAQIYTLLFAFAGTLMLLNAFCLACLRDIPHTHDMKAKASLLESIKRMPALFKGQKHYRLQLIARAFFVVSSSCCTLGMVFAKGLPLETGQFSTLVIMQSVGTLLAGLVLSGVGRRYGNRVTSLITFGLGGFAALFALPLQLMPAGMPLFLMSCLLIMLNSCVQGSWFTSYNYMLDIVPEKSRPTAVLMLSLVNFPLNFLAIGLSSLAAFAGFTAVYIIAAVCAAVSVTIALKYLKPPQIADYLNSLEEGQEEEAHV